MGHCYLEDAMSSPYGEWAEENIEHHLKWKRYMFSANALEYVEILYSDGVLLADNRKSLPWTWVWSCNGCGGWRQMPETIKNEAEAKAWALATWRMS